MKIKKNQKLSRRQILQQGTLGVAGFSLLDMYANMLPRDLQQALALGSQEARAEGAGTRAHPVIQITLIDKWQQPLFLQTEGTVDGGDLNGLDGAGTMYKEQDISGQANSFVNFRGNAAMSMTQLFGGRLSGMADGYNMAVIPKVNSNAGGHNLAGSILNADVGGLNNAIQEAGPDEKNLLGFVGFEIRADANAASESVRARNGIPLPTFESPSQLRETLKNSVRPLTASDKALAFRRKLDALAVKDSGVLATLLEIKDRIEPAVASLTAAMSPDLNDVEKQVASVIALAKAGLCNNFMICIPWDDTNGGNSLTNNGGNLGLSPYVGTAMLADVYVKISQELPEAITVIVSDGGRSRNNGDAAGGMSIVTGPASVVSDGIFGAKSTVATLGNVNGLRGLGDPYKMSSGADLGILEHRHLHAMILKMLGIHDTTAPYPTEISPKAT